MARMIPNNLRNSHNSEGEPLLFQSIKNNEKTKNWTVLHSLNMKNSICEGFTEADFVLLVPNKGIFIIEVKAGKELIYTKQSPSNKSYFTSINKCGVAFEKKGDDDPFVQSKKEKDCLIKYLTSKGYNNVYVENCVAFNNIKFDYNDITNPIHDKRKIFDIDKDDIDTFINSIFSTFYNRRDYVIKESDVDCLLPMFRPNINYKITIDQQLNSNNLKIEHSTESVNDEIWEKLKNFDRALVYGSAGTGKTYLAKKLIDYKLSISNTSKIGFFSHNILFSSLIANEYKNEERVFCRPFKEFFEEHYKKFFEKQPHELYKDPKYDSIIPRKPNYKNKNLFEDTNEFNKIENDYYSEYTYDNMLVALKNIPIIFDVIIIDEAQDILNPQALIIISLMLKRKMSKGQWYFFGDFTHQLIYDKSIEKYEIEQYMSAMSFNGDDADYKIFKGELLYNCRNSYKIVEEINKLLGINTICASKAKYGDVQYIDYIDPFEEITKLDNLLDDLINNGVLPSQITILSNTPIKENKLLEESNLILSKYCKDKMSYFDSNNDTITCSKIRRYKGLENDIVILLDLCNYKERDSNNQNIDMLYIGLTRAFSAVYIFETYEEKKFREQNTRKR